MSYKRSSLMQEWMEQNRKSILSSARKIISEGGFKDAQIQTIAEQAVYLVDWFIATSIIKAKC